STCSPRPTRLRRSPSPSTRCCCSASAPGCRASCGSATADARSDAAPGRPASVRIAPRPPFGHSAMFEIGNSLREARARRKLTYDQVEAETKIRAKYIRCLEDEEYDALPSGTYVKGFLRTYADYLGLDGQLYVDEYNSRFGDTHHEDQLFRRRERPVPRRRQTKRGVMVALAGIVAVGVLFFVAWRFGGEKATPPVDTPPPTATTHVRASNPNLPTRTHATTTPTHRTHRKPPPPPKPKFVKL